MFYKVISNIPLLFEILLILYQVQIKGGIILHIAHIGGAQMIEVGIYDMSIVNNLGLIIRVINGL